jgi:hypothetical protein
MTRTPTRCSGYSYRATAQIAILMLAVILTIAPEVFAWGFRRFGGGGFGGFGGFGGGAGPGPGGDEGPNSAGGQMYIYPSRGQSPQQEQNDRGQCYGWAIQQTGFNPANPSVPGGPPPAVGAPQGGLFRGAAGGAAMGAIGGAIGGSAGTGAAIGAAAGGLFGGLRRRRWREQEASQQSSYLEQQQSALDQGNNNFRQAFAVCMTGRGYTVGG